MMLAKEECRKIRQVFWPLYECRGSERHNRTDSKSYILSEAVTGDCQRILERAAMSELSYSSVQSSVSGYISKEEYRKSVEVLHFLNGTYDPILEKLKAQMEEASEALGLSGQLNIGS